jgi:hypothetical protein
MTDIHRQIEHALTNLKLAIDESLAGEDAAVAIDEVRALTRARDRRRDRRDPRRAQHGRHHASSACAAPGNGPPSHAALTGSQSNTSLIVKARRQLLARVPLPSPERCEQTGQGCLSKASKSHFHRRCELEDGR